MAVGESLPAVTHLSNADFGTVTYVRAPTELDSMCTGVVANVTVRGVLVYEGMDMPDMNLYPRPPKAIAENQFYFYITTDAVYSLGGG